MENTQGVRRLRLIPGLVILGGLLFCQGVSALDAKLSLANDRFVVGQKFVLDLLVNAPDPLQVKLSQPTYPSSLSLTDGPFIREASWEDSAGKLSKGTKITLNFRVNQAGLATLGPFGLTSGSQSFVIPSRTLYLLAADEAKKRFPLEVVWNLPPGPYYLGQDIPLLLQVRNLDTLIKPQDLQIPAPAGALWEKAVGLGEIEISSAGEDRIMNIPWGGWMLIPTQAGTVSLPPVTVSVGDLQRKTPALDLNVLNLPAEASSSRAVGDLTYFIDAEEGKETEEGQIIVTQEVRGRGNFPYLVLPEVKVPGLRLLSRREGNNYRPTTTGYQGSLSLVWHFIADKAGTFRVSLPGFVSFQPDLNKVWTWDERSVTLSINSAGGSQPEATPVNQFLDWNGVLAARSLGLVTQPWILLFFLPGPIFFLLTFFFKGTKGRGLIVLLPLSFLLIMAQDPAPAGFDAALKTSQSGTAADALPLWDALLQKSPHEAGLWYDKGVAAQMADQTASAVQSFRKAVYWGFQGRQATAALKLLEEREQLVDQFEPWKGPSPDILLIALIALVNLVFFFWGLQRTTGKVVWTIPLTLTFLAALLTGGATLSWLTARDQVSAVVGLTDGPIRKVPGDLAEGWMTLKQGTVVHFLGYSGDSFLVQTGYGLEGWVKNSFLLRVKDE